MDTSTDFHAIEDNLSPSDLVAQITDHSSPVVVKAVYPETSCVSATMVMWPQTTTQSDYTEATNHFRSTYGAAMAFKPHSVLEHVTLLTVLTVTPTQTQNIRQSALIDSLI